MVRQIQLFRNLVFEIQSDLDGYSELVSYVNLVIWFGRRSQGIFQVGFRIQRLQEVSQLGWLVSFRKFVRFFQLISQGIQVQVFRFRCRQKRFVSFSRFSLFSGDVVQLLVQRIRLVNWLVRYSRLVRYSLWSIDGVWLVRCSWIDLVRQVLLGLDVVSQLLVGRQVVVVRQIDYVVLVCQVFVKFVFSQIQLDRFGLLGCDGVCGQLDIVGQLDVVCQVLKELV